jgi:hypothetical protein
MWSSYDAELDASDAVIVQSSGIQPGVRKDILGGGEYVKFKKKII